MTLEELLRVTAVAQIDVIVGDIEGNVERIRRARAQAAELGAKLVIFPELVIPGYPPQDLVYREDFRKRCMDALSTLAKETADGGPAMMIGTLWTEGVICYNCAVTLKDGKIHHLQAKQMLPNYGVFDEKRIFAHGRITMPMEFEGLKIGVLICEDMWFEDVPAAMRTIKADLAIVINASPFEIAKHETRVEIAQRAVDLSGAPLLYVNMVGAQDDLIFDGGSFFMDALGNMRHEFPVIEQSVAIVTSQPESRDITDEEATWKALTTALADYVNKNNFPGVLLGLSGGIDSAMVATIAVDALGADRVFGVLLPSKYTADESNNDALQLAQNLGIYTQTIPIEPLVGVSSDTLGPVFEAFGSSPDVFGKVEVGGNVQARLRGLLLMALSNATGYMLLGTSNKSEVAVGYTTLYGDSCGGYSVLKDVYKTQIYILANWRNRQTKVIPENCITRAPTAELAPGQKDEDQLPPYASLDRILSAYIEAEMPVEEIVAEGHDRELVEKIIRMVRNNEYKRRQMPPGAKVSSMYFGGDWRYPLTNRFTGI